MPEGTYNPAGLSPYPFLCETIKKHDGWSIALFVAEGPRPALKLDVRNGQGDLLASSTSRLPTPTVFRTLARKCLDDLAEQGYIQKRKEA